MTAANPSPLATTQVALRIDPRRKLIPLEWFAVLHGLRPYDAIEMVDDGTLWPAFNLATRNDGGKRKIHLWRGVVEHYDPILLSPKLDAAKVIAASLPPLGVLPAADVTIRGSELGYRWCCGYHRIRNLIRAGELREVGHRRPCDTPRMNYLSVVKFLERRVI